MRFLAFILCALVSSSALAGPPANVVHFGADPTGGQDSTAAIQAAITSTFVSSPGFGPHQTAGAVVFPPGIYRVSSIDATGLVGLSIRATPGTVIIYADRQLIGEQLPAIDLSGTVNSQVVGIIVSGQEVSQQNPPGPPYTQPSAGFLLSDTVEGGRCTKNTLRKVGTIGHFSHAALYMRGCTDNLIEDSAFQQANPNAHALFVGGVNPFDTPSHRELAPQWTNQASGDNTFFHVELHNAFTGGGTNATTARFQDTYTNRFFAGLSDATGGPGHVQINGSVLGLQYHGTQFYAEGGVPAAVLFRNDGALLAPLLLGCSYQTQNGPLAVFGGNPATDPTLVGNF